MWLRTLETWLGPIPKLSGLTVTAFHLTYERWPTDQSPKRSQPAIVQLPLLSRESSTAHGHQTADPCGYVVHRVKNNKISSLKGGCTLQSPSYTQDLQEMYLKRPDHSIYKTDVYVWCTAPGIWYSMSLLSDCLIKGEYVFYEPLRKLMLYSHDN